MNEKRAWLIGVMVYGLTVPAEEFAAALVRNAFLCGKANQATKLMIDGCEGGTFMGLCVQDEAFLEFGAYWFQYLNDLCDPHSAAEGNEFLSTYGSGEGQAPADSMFATLAVTFDNGNEWHPARQVPIMTGTPKN